MADKIHSEKKLVYEWTENKELAFKEIYDLYFFPLFRHACKMLKDEDQAADVVQDVFIVLWTRPKDWQVEKTISAFLFTCLRNKILDLIKHEKVKSTHFEDLLYHFNQQSPQTDHLVREKELSSLIEREIGLLPDRMQQVFKLSRLQHLSYKEIAEKAQVSEGTVRKQIYYALKTLRSKLNLFLILTLISFLLYH